MDVKLLFLMNCAIAVYCQSTLTSRKDFEMFEDVKFEIDSIRQLLLNLQQRPLKNESPVIQEMKSQIEDIRQVVLKHLNWRQKACPPGFDYLRETSSCVKVILKRMNWDDATAKCRQVMPGVHLVMITSQAENDAIVRYLQSHLTRNNNCEGRNNLWISGQTRDPRQCGSYVWKPLAGIEIPFNYTNWSPGSPDCWKGGENCPEIVESFNYKWSDVPCYSLSCPICELRV